MIRQKAFKTEYPVEFSMEMQRKTHEDPAGEVVRTIGRDKEFERTFYHTAGCTVEVSSNPSLRPVVITGDTRSIPKAKSSLETYTGMSLREQL